MTTRTKTDDVSTEVEIVDETNMETWFRAHGEDVPSVDAESMQRDIVARILSAETMDDILAPVANVKAEDVLGVPLVIRGYRRLPSTKKDSSLRFYLLLDAVDPDGEPITVTCGSVNVMARIISLAHHGHLPCIVAITKAKTQTAAGYYPLDVAGRSTEDREIYARAAASRNASQEEDF